jgi:hypothetical protein
MMKNTTLMTEQVLDKIDQMCQVLYTNYQSSSIERHRKSIENDINMDYHQKMIEELSMGEGCYKFSYVKGRKYAKIVMQTPAGQKSVHAFVDITNGDVYKPATWKAPAKNGVRYNLMDEKSRMEMYQRADWAGGYLYK